MPAPKGNQYYKLASNIGRNTVLTPQQFFDKANEYFDYIDKNPHQKKKTETYRGEIKETIEYFKRPYTIEGLCLHVGITRQTFLNYENSKEFVEAIAYARDKIYNNKLDGATAGLFNANVVIRDLQLKDNSVVTHEQGVMSLGTEEIKQLKSALADMYGTIQPVTIDIEAKDG